MKPLNHSRPSYRRWMVTLSALLMAGALILSACQPTPTPVPPTTAPTSPPPPTPTTLPTVPVEQLYNTIWVLVGYGDANNPTVVPQGTAITAEFNPDGTLSGFAGCNNYTTQYQASPNGTMSINQAIATTRMACPQGMDVETAYLGALGTSQLFSFNAQGRLEITYTTGAPYTEKLVFTQSAAPLTNTQWVLVSYGNPSSPTSLPAGNNPITAVFTPEGTVSGSSGCNTYAGQYSLNGQQMMVSPLAVTAMACASGMDTESTYLAALQGAYTYKITGAFLQITYDSGKSALNYTSASLPLTGTEWGLAAINGVPVSPDIQANALFVPGEKPDSGTVSGSAGCNSYTAGYTVNGTNLTITSTATTRMICPDPTMQVEQSYLNALQSTQSYQIFGSDLLLTTSAGMLTFTANRTPLQGALWVLTGIGPINKLQAPAQGTNFTAQFTRSPGAVSGVVAGATGCNEYAATFTASTTEMKVNLPQKTQNTCTAAQQEAEQQYFLSLNAATTYRIAGNTLVILYDNNQQALVYEGTQLNVAGKQPLSNLNNTTWYLWAINDQATIPGALVTALVTINSDGQSGNLSGSAGCNTYVASFGESLGMKTSLSSQQNCTSPNGIMEQEQAYLQALSTSYGYWQTGGQLIINTGKGPLTYMSQPPASASDQTHLLQNTTWFLYSYNNQHSVVGSAESNVIFSANGALNGFTGCNNLSGTYTTNINQISIKNLTRTSNLCPNQAATTQEQAVMAILGSAQTYQVADTSMQIVGSSGVLNYSMTPVNRPSEVVPPAAVITAPAQANVGQEVTFDASKSTAQVPITAYDWEFGDGGKAKGAVVKHTYVQPGTYTVQMTVTDQRGVRGSAKQTIQIVSTATPTATPTAPPQPTATGQPPQPTATPTAPEKPTATNVPQLPTATSQPQQPTATGQPPQPTNTPVPEQPTATQPPAPTETSVPPTAPPQPTATPLPVLPPKAVIQGSTSGFVGEPVTFSASASTPGSSPIQSYTWNFGDGGASGPSNNPDVTYLYNYPGTYTVQLVVTDANGQTSQATQDVSINARLNTAVWSLQGTLKGTSITLQFLSGQIAGFAGCNAYSGSYTATDNGDGTYTITTGSVAATTKQSCSSEVMNQENKYLNTLQGVTTAQISGNVLNLSGSNGKLTYNQIGSVSATPY